jgi:hypothetical protein
VSVVRWRHSEEVNAWRDGWDDQQTVFIGCVQYMVVTIEFFPSTGEEASFIFSLRLLRISSGGLNGFEEGSLSPASKRESKLATKVLVAAH